MNLDWRCKLCGLPVTKNYDHVGSDCGPTATEDDCTGTFSHPTQSTCVHQSRDLTHEMVEV